jgi:hypothetical protein
MKQNKLGVIINYCTMDERFIRVCIDQALQVSDQVIVSVADHLFNGTPEDEDKLIQLSVEYPGIVYIWEWEDLKKPPHYYHNLSRIVGISELNKDITHVAFLDADELIHVEEFNKLIWDNDLLNDWDSIKLANYWYFYQPELQATKFEDSVVICRKDLINIDPDNRWEREQMFELLPANLRKWRGLSLDGKPVISHFSWVRSRETMKLKCKTWGHAGDKDNWDELIDDLFDNGFNGTDFVHGYNYKEVDNQFGL